MRIDPKYLKFTTPSGFLVLEGVNGAGKGTQQAKISEYLSSRGVAVHLTREPGATALGLKLREILLSQNSEKLDPWSELFLFLADRAEHVSKVILPKLRSGTLVICDRYYYSTLAFQGYGRGLDLGELLDANLAAVRNVLPDLCILLDLEPKLGLQRSSQRTSAQGEHDSFESEELAFHTRLREGFLHLASNLGERFLVLDAAQSPDQIFDQIRPVLDLWLEALGK